MKYNLQREVKIKQTHKIQKLTFNINGINK